MPAMVARTPLLRLRHGDVDGGGGVKEVAVGGGWSTTTING
jgi:hypothetical protein